MCIVVCFGFACSRSVSRDDVVDDAPLLDFPQPASRASIRHWYAEHGDQRSGSVDLDAAVPYVETALSRSAFPGLTSSSPYERVGFFLSRDLTTVRAQLLWQRPSEPAPAPLLSTTSTLWGMPLFRTPRRGELWAPAARIVVRAFDDDALPAVARVDGPADVVIDGVDRAAYRDQLFVVDGGRLWFKRNPAASGTREEPWRLFLEGRPSSFADDAEDLGAGDLVSVSADGDDVVVVDSAGRVFVNTTQSSSLTSVSGWSGGWGFPGKRPLVVDGRASHARSLAIGRRAEHALWFEDAIGNRHHMGPMGTSTLYVLADNGRQIVFTDNGLPNDFSRDLCGPDDGRFVADRLAVSASALLLIDAGGRMFTRFEDYDLNGGTPNFVYTYRSDVRPDDDETSVVSSLTPYFLPLQPWRRQPSISLTGKARISHDIGVEQTGEGNSARRLRVAGDDAAGRRGFYEKGIDDDAWSFVADDSVVVDDDAWLTVSAEPPPSAPSWRRHFRGSFEGAVVDVDLHPFCSPAVLRFTTNDVSFDVVLHTVDFWTPARRSRPGVDGTPLLMQGTLVFSDDVLRDVRPAVRRLVERLRAHHQQTFSLVVALDGDELLVRSFPDGVGERHPLAIGLKATEPPPPSSWWTPQPLLPLAERERQVQEVQAFLDDVGVVGAMMPVWAMGRVGRLPTLLEVQLDEDRRSLRRKR